MADLYELIPRYYENKEVFDKYKKLVDTDKDLIKSAVLARNPEGSKVKSGDIEVNVSVITKKSFDDDKLVAKLRELWSNEHGSMTNPYLKMVYVPDMEAIENALYNKELNPEDIADCKIIKKEVRLTAKKVEVKGGTED